jgi:hypothetical protein
MRFFFIDLLAQDVVPLSLVRLHPHTGLKHQLRVHMARVLGGTFGPDLLRVQFKPPLGGFFLACMC